MSTTNQTSGRRQELHRRKVGPRTLVTPDNAGLLLEKDTLLSISNRISKITKQKLTPGDVPILIQFVQDLPPNQFYQLSLSESENRIASLFVNRNKNFQNSLPYSEGDISNLARIDEVTTDGTVSDYLREEVLQTTANENQYKYSAHAERRGNSVIDRDRVKGLRSSPDSIASSHIDLAKSLAPMSKFFDPENIDEIFARANSSIPGLQTYQNITLPHRIIPLDSRNRIQSHVRSNEVKWNLHAAGQPGRLGDIRIQDTLKEIIEVKICPFWLPVNNPLDDYYSTVRLHIREFWQHSEVTEFLNSDESIPTVYGYHFEFEITRRERNRIYLEPVCSSYKFHKPIARVETLTFGFRSPFRTITVEADRGTFTATYSPAAGDPTSFALTSGGVHGLSTGDLVYFIDFSSANVTINSEINREEGHIITRIDDTTFTIASDTNVLAPGTLTGNTVLYGSKRIIVQLEFTSLER